MYYPNLQLLRIVAAVGVVVHHVGAHAQSALAVPAEKVGFLLNYVVVGFPVPLFFAVSGFVLTHAAQGSPRGHSPARFLLARFLRLFPGYWLALAVTIAMAWAGLLSALHRELVPLVSLGTVSLWPSGGRSVLMLGIEWSLIYEVFLSVALCGLALFGRRLGFIVGCWLVVLAVKAIVAPEIGTRTLPHWKTIGLSAWVVPFLLGVLVYKVRDRGWPGWAVVVMSVAIGAVRVSPWEIQIWCWGIAAAATVWLAVRLPQLAANNRLTRLGDATYGLFLIHVPVLLAVMYAFARVSVLSGQLEGALLAGAIALGMGFAFGRLEAAIYARLRPIGKWTATDFRVKLRLPRIARLPR